MCGIIGVVDGQTNDIELVFEGLKTLEYRGYDSWGIAAITNANRLWLTRQVGAISEGVIKPVPQAKAAVGHTRWATHGGVSVLNAHPHISEDGKLAVVHNGIVENHTHLREMLLKHGHTFTSDTDTEVIVHLMEEALAKSLTNVEALQSVMDQLTGSNAVVILNFSTQSIMAATSGSPLLITQAHKGSVIASDAMALAPFGKKMYGLQTDEVWQGTVQGSTVYRHNRVIPIDWQILPVTSLETGKNGFAHYMLKEIHEQPSMIRRLMTNQWPVIRRFQDQLKTHQLMVCGCGSAYHAALAGTYLLTDQRRWVCAVVASELSAWQTSIQPSQTVLFLSQSGETADILGVARILKEKNIHLAAMINRPYSSLEQLGLPTLLLGAGPELAVVATKSFSAKLVALLMLSTDKTQQDSLNSQLQSVIEEMNTVLTDTWITKNLMPIIERLIQTKQLFVIGREKSYPMALEIALKIKESSYVPAEGMAGGELKHGTLALIESGTYCLALCPNDETFESTLSNVAEIKARGGAIVGLAAKNHELFDMWLPVPDCGRATMLIQTMIGQLLAYYLAVALGRNPDRPRNLAKSVTVR